MPLIRIDYHTDKIPAEPLTALVQGLLDFSTEAFHYTKEEGLDKISIFTKAYDLFDHSAAAAEIEVRAKVSEFDHPTKSRDEVRQEYMDRYKVMLSAYVAKHDIAAGIVFTITFEDWSVVWLPPASA
jgi:hypothetical protein